MHEQQEPLIAAAPKTSVGWEEESARLIESAVKAIRRDWRYTNDGEAFVHLFVRSYFNLDDDEASQACEVGYGGNDKGIDALYVDAVNGVTYVVGGKAERRSYGEEVVTDARRAFDFLNAPEPGKVKKALHEAWEVYQQRLEKGSTTYLIAVYGTLNQDAVKAAEKLSPDFERKQWTIELLQSPEILIYASAPIAAPGKGPNVAFRLQEDDHAHSYTLPGKPRYCVAFVNGGQLADEASKSGPHIFALNLREYLTKNPVNERIEASLKNDGTRKIFAYLNLGIDAICDHFDKGISAQRVLPDNQPQFPELKVRNFRIVNGCQTTMTLFHNRQFAAECLVMLRLVETRKEDLAFQIAVAKNRQTPIKDRELFAFDNAQRLIAEKLRQLPKPFFYARRRGEWPSRRRAPKYRKLFGERRVDNDKVGRAYLATVMQRPFEAKQRSRYIFRLKREGGLYEDIFKPGVAAEDLIRAHEFFTVALDECKKLTREHRDLTRKEEKEGLTDEEKSRLHELSYIVHGDTYLAALMWYLCSKHVHDAKKTDRAFVTFDSPMNDKKRKRLQNLFSETCKVVVKDLGVQERVTTKQHLRFNVRNFFALTDSYSSLTETADSFVEETTMRRIME
jgi:hypothetical protein